MWMPVLTLIALVANSAEPQKPGTEYASLFRSGSFSEAELVARRDLAASEEALGELHPEVAEKLNALAEVKQALGKLEDADALYKRSLDIYTGSYGEGSLETSIVLANLAGLRKDQGDYDGAQAFFEQSISIRKEGLGPDDPQVATVVENLGSLFFRKGSYEAAGRHLEDAIRIWEAHLAENPNKEISHELALALDDLALLMATTDQDERAKDAREQSLRRYEEGLGDNHILVATAAYNLARAHAKLGNKFESRSLYARSLAIREKVLRNDHPDIATSAQALANALLEFGDHAAARPLYERCLRIREGTFGQHHTRTASALEGLAMLYVTEGQFDEAQEIFERSLRIWEEAVGNDHPQVAVTMSRLGDVRKAQGDLGTARRHYLRSLKINEESEAPPDAIAAALGRLASVTADPEDSAALHRRRVALLERVHGADHADVATALYDQATQSYASGDIGAARAPFERSLDIRRNAYGRDDPRVAEVLAGLAAVVEGLGPTLSRRFRSDALRIAEARMQSLKSLSRREALVAAASARDYLDSWLITFNEPGDHEESWAHIREHRTGLIKLTRPHGDFAATDTATLCEASGSNRAMVDYWQHFDGREDRYLAFVMGADCQIQRLDLGSVQEIDAAIATWRNDLADTRAPPDQAKANGVSVSDFVWTPLQDIVGEATELAVIVDGNLGAVPFSALPIGGGQYLLERMTIRHLDRPSDIQRPGEMDAAGELLIVREVIYNARPPASERHSRLAPCVPKIAGVGGRAWDADRIARRWKGTSTETLRQGEATEAAVSAALSGKAIAHVATRGFLSLDTCHSALDWGGDVGFDPTLMTGLAFAGANRPIGRQYDDEVLTASEIGRLDLSGTGLLVLPALYTPDDRDRSGEGIIGLRRALAAAGSRSSVLSLWTANEGATAEVLEGFYHHLLHKREPLAPAEAMRQAQLTRLALQRSRGKVLPREWAGFVPTGG